MKLKLFKKFLLVIILGAIFFPLGKFLFKKFQENYKYYNPTHSRFGRDTTASFEDGRFQIGNFNEFYGLTEFNDKSSKTFLKFLNYEINPSWDEVYMINENLEASNSFHYYKFQPKSGRVDVFKDSDEVPKNLIEIYQRLLSEVIKATPGLPKRQKAFPQKYKYYIHYD